MTEENTAKSGEGLEAIVAPLLAWYEENARALPWRLNRDPYRVWVSEIMLQQTQVETALPYYNRFLAAVPDLQSLAELDEGQLLKLWEGLGYYSRARHLQQAARMIREKFNNRFPEDYPDILSLPGIGPYTAGAIASICFDQPRPAVDGNVLRVMARLTGDAADIAAPAMKLKISKLLEAVYPTGRAGDFTQSLMELGALICQPKPEPQCGLCPLAFCCQALARGQQAVLPVKAKSRPKRLEQKTVFLLLAQDQVALRQRPARALLARLWEFPNVEGALTPGEAAGQLSAWGLTVAGMRQGPGYKHVFTHVVWEMTSYVVSCTDTVPGFTWATREALAGKLALPSAFQPFCQAF